MDALTVRSRINFGASKAQLWRFLQTPCRKTLSLFGLALSGDRLLDRRP